MLVFPMPALGPEDDDLSAESARIALVLAAAVAWRALTVSASCAMVVLRSSVSLMAVAQEADEDEVGDVGAAGGVGEVCGKERIAGIVIPGCQVPRHPTTPDRDYVACSCAPVLTARFCPSAGGLRLVEREIRNDNLLAALPTRLITGLYGHWPNQL